MWLGGRICKELLRWSGVPQELFDVVEECMWGGWCMGLKGVEVSWGMKPTKTIDMSMVGDVVGGKSGAMNTTTTVVVGELVKAVVYGL